MATKIQNMPDYNRYIKCGEILKSPEQNYLNPFVVKCFYCEEIQFHFESFIIHIQEHCNYGISASHAIQTNQEQVDSEGLGVEKVIKLEDNNAMDTEDPLIVVKNEIDVQNSTVKEESHILPDTSVLNKCPDIEHHDDFEEVVFDSSDEIQPDDSVSEEDEIINASPKKRKKKSSPLVDKFMKSKANVTTLIELYKNQPYLWNKDSSQYRLKDKRQQFLQELTQDLNNKLTRNLTCEEVNKIISYICRKHRDDLRRLQNHKDQDKNGKKYIRCWYFEDLHFLRPNKNIQLEKLDLQLPDLLPEQITKILEIYQGFPYLWNSNLIEYVCSNKRHDAHIELLKMLESTMNIKITKNVLEEYLRSVHSYFSREKSLKLNNTLKNGASTTESESAPEYYEHMIFLYDHEGPFNCSECNRVHSNPFSFRVHKSTHDGSVPLICSQCKKEFKNVPLYTRHAKRHLEDREFVCKECDRMFLNHKDLEVHMLTHNDARPYCCEICGASYRHFQYFKNHQRRHEKRFSHTCHICSKGYYSKDRYDDHMNSHLNIRSHICKLCGKGFITSRALKTHSVTHDDVRNHACNLCGKTFKLKIGVLQHMRTHGSNLRSEALSQINVQLPKLEQHLSNE